MHAIAVLVNKVPTLCRNSVQLYCILRIILSPHLSKLVLGRAASKMLCSECPLTPILQIQQAPKVINKLISEIFDYRANSYAHN